MTPDEFFPMALPYARWASPQTGVLVSVILAQWADETAYGGPDWTVYHNPGNVGSYDGQPVHYFPTLEAGLLAYVQTMNLPYYDGVRAARAAGAVAQAEALGASPWASGHYGNPPGADLVWIIQNYNLTQYDGPPAESEGYRMWGTESGGQLHVFAVLGGNVTVHYWQALPGTVPAGTPGGYQWHSEVLPTPAGA